MLIAGRVASGGGLAEGWLEIRAETVAAAGTGPPPGAPDVDWNGVVAPGLVDLQVNGAAGAEVTGSAADVDRIEAALLAHGVTSWLATIVTRPDEEAAAAVAALAGRVADPASPLAGIHLEGPFLAPARRGIHRAEWLRAPAAGVPAHYDSDAIRLVTLAPELPGALDLITRLRARGVHVSLGHSQADAATVAAAVDAGARLVTHLFNAMPPVAAREPGLAGAALADERLQPMLIADGIHVAGAALELARRAAGERLILTSDSSPAAAATPGRYELAGVPIESDPAGSVRGADGRLGGSAVLLDACVRTFTRLTDATLAQAVAAAADRPAAVLGNAAPLSPGSAADLVLLDEAGGVQAVMRRGAWISAP